MKEVKQSMVARVDDKNDRLKKVLNLRSMYLKGLLGGEIMPEDNNPNLPKQSAENYLYFTLPMALNYQRNSYSLWEAANKTYHDQETVGIFDPVYVCSIDEGLLRSQLMKHKVALQPNKHVSTWSTLCRTLYRDFEGDIRNLFIICGWHIPSILQYIQKENKRDFPYLCGPKICNYWLYVISNYTDSRLTGKEYLSIAPDTHVIQATKKLGLIDEKQMESNDLQNIVNVVWGEQLAGTELALIDLHTPLWLWSRGGFKKIIE